MNKDNIIKKNMSRLDTTERLTTPRRPELTWQVRSFGVAVLGNYLHVVTPTEGLQMQIVRVSTMPGIFHRVFKPDNDSPLFSDLNPPQCHRSLNVVRVTTYHEGPVRWHLIQNLRLIKPRFDFDNC